MIDQPPAAGALAAEVWAALQGPRQITPFSTRFAGFDLPLAYAVADKLRTLRGEQVVGRKIGFTNRTIWPRYGVNAPMWGDMTSSTVAPITAEPVAIAAFAEPRLEPEVALKLSASPQVGMDEGALLSCVEWFAPAFEIVQSVYRGWAFALADCAAANGLHGRLLLGPPVANGSYAAALPDLTLSLSRGGTLVETGHGKNVLGGPLSALRFLVEALHDAGEPRLKTGDLITTGTLTDAWPINPGDVFAATYSGTPFGTIEATFRL